MSRSILICLVILSTVVPAARSVPLCDGSEPDVIVVRIQDGRAVVLSGDQPRLETDTDASNVEFSIHFNPHGPLKIVADEVDYQTGAARCETRDGQPRLVGNDDFANRHNIFARNVLTAFQNKNSKRGAKQLSKALEVVGGLFY